LTLLAIGITKATDLQNLWEANDYTQIDLRMVYYIDSNFLAYLRPQLVSYLSSNPLPEALSLRGGGVRGADELATLETMSH